jgi:hypothetical protein
LSQLEAMPSQFPAGDPPPVGIMVLPALVGALVWLCLMLSRVPH